MNIAKVERVSGHTVLHGEKCWLVYCACGHRQRTIRIAAAGHESDELRQLMADIYRHHCAIVRENQGFKCGLCGELKPLECHHKEGRGMASSKRSDRVEDLIALCSHCHNEAETQNLSV